MSIQHVSDKKLNENVAIGKKKSAILSLIHIFKLAIIITYIQFEVLQNNYQVVCRSRGVIYNKDGKFIYKPAKASQGHIIVIEDRHPESSRHNFLPQQTTPSLLHHSVAAPSSQPIQLVSARAYQHGGGIESASSMSPVRATGMYSNGQIQLINLNDLQGLVAPSHSAHANFVRPASESSNHYQLESRFLPPQQQPVQILPMIQLYHPSKYQTSSLLERPYSLISVPGSPSMANLGINQDYDRLHNDHNPILDNSAPIIAPGQYNPAQNYQQHHQQHLSTQYSQNQAAGQAQGQTILLNNQQSTRPRSDSDPMVDDFNNSPSYYDHPHERQPPTDSAFIDDQLAALSRHISPHSDDNSIRPHAVDSQVRPKMSSLQELSSEHADDISDGGSFGTTSQLLSSKFNQFTDISNPKTTNQGIFGRSAIVNLNNLNSHSNNSQKSNSSKDHIMELEDRHKKSSISNLDTLGKSKLLKTSKRNLRNKSIQIHRENRKIDNNYKAAPIDDDLNSRDVRGTQYWNHFKDQFEIM